VSELGAALARISTDLRILGARWAVVGGLALAVRAEPRQTRDIDIAIAVDHDREAEDLIRNLRDRGYRDNPDGALIEQTDVGRLATCRLISPSGVVIDLMFASSGIEPEIVAGAERLEVLPGVSAAVIQRGHLLALKVLAGRLQDQADAVRLLAEATEQDRDLAAQALGLISGRGFGRGKDLQAELAKLLRFDRGGRAETSF
jgi:hypothetical protein